MGEVMNLLLYRFFRAQIYGILMFYVKDLQKQHRKRNLVAWRLMALVWILDIIILYKGSSYFPISYFVEPMVFFVVCFVVVPCFWEVSTCPACGRRIFFDRWCQVIVQSVRVNLFSFRSI